MFNSKKQSLPARFLLNSI